MSPSSDPGGAPVHLLATGGELIALSGDAPGRRWPMQPDAWLRQVCAVVGRDFTRVEWEQYLPGRPYEPTCSDLG